MHWRTPVEHLPELIRSNRRDRVLGGGLGLSFGIELLRHTGIPVGLIMVAHGGTSMSQWDENLAHEGGRSLYGAMLRTVNTVGGKVKGCLWYQGESDAYSDDAARYSDRMVSWVERLRRDVGDPDLPFIYAQLSRVFHWGDEAAWNQVQNLQFLLESKLGCAALVPTIDAGLSDIIHLDTPSLKDLGHRMAWQALRLVHKRVVAQSGPRLAGTFWNDDRTELTLEFTGINGHIQYVEKVFAFHAEADGCCLPLTAYLMEDRQHIMIQFEQPAPQDCLLKHGRGINPVVNVKDELGIPLVVFGPVLV